MGLPENGATYSLLEGKILYRDILPNGTNEVKKEEFTGEILVGAYLEDKAGENNYAISFKVIFFKGELKGVELESLIPENKAEFEKINQQIVVDTAIRNKRENSFWYKYIYKPYRVILRLIGWALIIPISLIRWIITKTILFLTPY